MATGDSIWRGRYDPGVPPEVAPDYGLLTEALERAAARYPRRCAVWSTKGALSYQQLLSEVQKFAALLAGLGVRAGDRVLLVLPNSPQLIVAIYGTLWRGATAVLSSLHFPDPVLRTHLVDCQSRLAVFPHPLPANLEPTLRREGPEHLMLSSGREYVRTVRGWLRTAVGSLKGRALGSRSRKILRWRALMGHAQDGFPLERVDPGSPALILYTGGTTGLPRGVVLSHRALVCNSLQLALWDTRMKPGRERILAGLPLSHAYGFTTGVGLAMHLAGSLIVADSSAPEVLLELCSRFRPTLFPGVPAIYSQLLNRANLRSYGLRSIRACISGAAPLAVEVQEGFERVTKGRLVEGYGLTEAGPVTHANPFYGERRTGSIGLPLPSTEAKVVCPETLQELPAGQVGELWVRGPQLMDGYFHNPQASAQALVGGWLRTGDLAQYDRDGYFYLICRRSEALEISGKTVYPRDIEEVLFEYPAVAEAAVIGWPPGRETSRLGGQVVGSTRAFLVTRPGQHLSVDELEAFCRRRLAGHMVPHYWTVTPALPRNPFGKVDRRALHLMVEEFGL